MRASGSLLFLPSENFERLYATGFRDPGPLAVLLTLCQTVPVTWRRRAPVRRPGRDHGPRHPPPALGFKPTFAEAAMVVSLYTVAAHRPRRQAVVAALAFAAAMVGYGLIAGARYPSPFQDSLQAWTLTFIQFAAAFFLDDLRRRRLATMAWNRLRRQLIDSDRQVRRSGHGLIGMRERVALFGGTLEAGADPAAATGWPPACRWTAPGRSGWPATSGPTWC